MKDEILKGLTEALLAVTGEEKLSDEASKKLTELAESVETTFKKQNEATIARLDEERKGQLEGITRCMEGAFANLCENRITDILHVAKNTELENLRTNLGNFMEACGYPAISQVNESVLADDRVKVLTATNEELVAKDAKTQTELKESKDELESLKQSVRKANIESLVEGVASDQAAKLMDIFESVEGHELSSLKEAKQKFLTESSGTKDGDKEDGEEQNLTESKDVDPKPQPKKVKRSAFRF